MSTVLMTLLVALVMVGCVFASIWLLVWVLGLSMGRHLDALAERIADQVRRLLGREPALKPADAPEHRPIEDIVAAVRRLGARFHALEPYATYVTSEAVRTAYDDVLGECCDALGLTHMLGVLGRGSELNIERARVEALLARSGVSLPYAA